MYTYLSESDVYIINNEAEFNLAKVHCTRDILTWYEDRTIYNGPGVYKLYINENNILISIRLKKSNIYGLRYKIDDKLRNLGNELSLITAAYRYFNNE